MDITTTASGKKIPTRFIVDEKHTKTYKTVEALDRVLEKLGFIGLHHVLVYTASGRVTAVFTDINANMVIFHGFSWVR